MKEKFEEFEKKMIKILTKNFSTIHSEKRAYDVIVDLKDDVIDDLRDDIIIDSADEVIQTN